MSDEFPFPDDHNPDDDLPRFIEDSDDDELHNAYRWKRPSDESPGLPKAQNPVAPPHAPQGMRFTPEPPESGVYAWEKPDSSPPITPPDVPDNETEKPPAATHTEIPESHNSKMEPEFPYFEDEAHHYESSESENLPAELESAHFAASADDDETPETEIHDENEIGYGFADSPDESPVITDSGMAEPDPENLEADIQHFLDVTGIKRAETEPPPESPKIPLEDEDASTASIPVDSAEDITPEDGYRLPDFTALEYDESSQESDTATAEDMPPESEPLARRSESPTPEDQSAFVNPAMSRVAAARPRKPPREPGEVWLALRTVVIILMAALVVAFIFNYWTPESFLSEEFVANLQVVNSTQGPPTAIPSPLPTFQLVQKIGIITGHSGPPLNPQFTVDPGAVCDENFDGTPELTELDINTSVALRVASILVEAGYEVELLNEWDDRIDNYRASALISIHTNTCENLGFGATGFNVKANERSAMIDRDSVLVDCLVANYGENTGLARHFGSPPDLADYHVFREVSIDTPTVIIELGFMFADRAVLTQQPDAMARGIAEGLECFLSPNSSVVPTQPAPSP